MPRASAPATCRLLLSLVLAVATLITVTLLGVSAETPGTAGYNDNQFDHCIIGAGPGGVQLGFFLQQANRNYVILERGSLAASFFDTYPRHRNLISINKKSTPRHGRHPDFRLRHDWNSLLSTRVNASSAAVETHSLAQQHPALLFGNWSDECVVLEWWWWFNRRTRNVNTVTRIAESMPCFVFFGRLSVSTVRSTSQQLHTFACVSLAQKLSQVLSLGRHAGRIRQPLCTSPQHQHTLQFFGATSPSRQHGARLKLCV